MHYNKAYTNKNKASKQKATYIIKRVPLQVIEKFGNSKKVYFIPKLLYKEETRGSSNNLASNSRVNSTSISPSRDSTSSNRDISDEELDRDAILEYYNKQFTKGSRV